MKEQLAGDPLAVAVRSRGTARSTNGDGVSPLGSEDARKDDGRKMEMDIIDEQIDTLGKAFMA
ncbi:MAG: hypothetical protein U1D30_05495 [Planctomycetota bacterium]